MRPTSIALTIAFAAMSLSATAATYNLRVAAKGVVAAVPQPPAPTPAPPAAPLTFATLDAASASNTGTLSADKLSWKGSAAYIRATLPMKVDSYFEVRQTQTGYVDVAITNGAAKNIKFELDSSGNAFVYQPSSSYRLPSWSGSTVIGVAWSVSTKKLFIYYDGVLRDTETFSGLTGDVYPVVYSNGGEITANFGAKPFAYGPPPGFAAGVSDKQP